MLAYGSTYWKGREYRARVFEIKIDEYDNISENFSRTDQCVLPYCKPDFCWQVGERGTWFRFFDVPRGIFCIEGQ